MTEPTDTPVPAKHADFTLDNDVTKDGAVLIGKGTKILVSKPMGGALRGVNLGGIVRMDFDQVAMLGPRVTTPRLPIQLAGVDPADVMQLAGALVDFLLPTPVKAALFPSA